MPSSSAWKVGPGPFWEQTEKLAPFVSQQEPWTEGAPIEPRHCVAHAIDHDR
jgi:hypothetical protein